MSDIKSNREEDSKIEEQMRKHYNMIYRILGYGYQRNDDQVLQKSGQDLLLTRSNVMKKAISDEKCATNYWDRDLDTFSMELSFNLCDRMTGLSTGNRVDGWFINDKNKTEVYSLGYVRSDSRQDLINGKVTSFEVIIVRKKSIQDYIKESISVDNFSELQNKFQNIILTGQAYQKANGGFSWDAGNGIRMTRSDQLAECPVNIIIKKEVLSSLSDAHAMFMNYSSDNRLNFLFKQIK